jgi:hypothetical protein
MVHAAGDVREYLQAAREPLPDDSLRLRMEQFIQSL